MAEAAVATPHAGQFVDENVRNNTSTRINNWKMFMWLFLAQDAMTFFTLFAGYLGLRIGADTWENAKYLNIPMTAIATFDLIVSSLTMVQAIAAIQRGDRKKMKMWLGLTIAGGAAFLVFQMWEYHHLLGEGGMAFTRHHFDTTFFMLTGFHGFHVLSGVIYLTAIYFKSHKYSAENYAHIEIVGLYWHFVDLVWIILFTLVYLV